MAATVTSTVPVMVYAGLTSSVVANAMMATNPGADSAIDTMGRYPLVNRRAAAHKSPENMRRAMCFRRRLTEDHRSIHCFKNAFLDRFPLRAVGLKSAI
jgi:hypothetical protein